MNTAFSQLASVFLLTQIQELAQLILAEEDFFAKKEKSRVKIIEAWSLPLVKPLLQYLATVDAATFLVETEGLAHDCLSGVIREKSQINTYVIPYLLDSFVPLVRSFIAKFDDISHLYWSFSRTQKIQYLNDASGLTAYEKSWLLKYSYQELGDSIYQTLKLFEPDIALVLVQSARECPSDIKRAIRHKYKKDYAVFTIAPSIMGGIRILVNGEMVDDSWANKLVRLRTLASIK